MLSVCYLNSVSLSIQRGDCMVIQHNDPARASMLAGALAGDPLLLGRPCTQTERTAHTGLRIRRAAIQSEVLPFIVKGWHEGLNVYLGNTRQLPARAVAEHAEHAPVLHLLRVSRVKNSSSSFPPTAGPQWQSWATNEASRQHAIVLLVQKGLESVPYQFGPKVPSNLQMVDGQLRSPVE